MSAGPVAPSLLVSVTGLQQIATSLDTSENHRHTGCASLTTLRFNGPCHCKAFTTHFMDLSLLYAVAAGGLAAVALVLQIARHLHRFFQDSLTAFLVRHVVYPLGINRHMLLGPWSRGMILFQVISWAVTVFCSSFQVHNPSEAATRTGRLSLINLVPLYFGVQLSFVADILGVSLRLWRQLHGTLGVIAVVLALVHAGISLGIDRGLLRGGKGLYPLLVSPYLFQLYCS